MGYFEEQAPEVGPLWLSESGEGTLRRAQLGALWAASAHFTRSNEPGQAVLPTGAGKTAVMTLLPFLVPAERVLIVTPSTVVRDQVAAEFQGLRVLRRTSTVPKGFKGPKVKKVVHQVRASSDWEALQEFDVVVGTPHTTSPAYSAIPPLPIGLFDLVLIDEGHHAAAETWSALISALAVERLILFTATPFRRDKKGLPGGIIYEYPLRRAIQDGIYRPIDFVPVELQAGEDSDAALASAASVRLADPQHAASALLIRTDRVADAQRLVDLYATRDIRLGLITGSTGLVKMRAILRELDEGRLHGLASVGVLGEGFDLPRLKIAVYHRRHKSLPATLQFIGRIARVAEGDTAPAELLAIREEVQDETRELYQDDASWAELIPALSESAIEEERERREYVGEFPVPDIEELSTYALRPRKMAQLFELRGEVNLDVVPENLAGGFIIYRGLDEQQQMLVLVTEHWVRPDWINSDALDVPHYEIHVVFYDGDNELLYVSSASEASTREILAVMGAEETKRVSPTAMNRLLWGLNLQGYSSVGMRSTRASGGRDASYRTAAGPAVQRAVMPSEARGYGVGHLIGNYLDDRNRSRSVGISVAKAKVWVPENVDLLSYRNWCREVSALISAGGTVAANAPLIDLLMPERLERFPELPVAAVLHHRLFNRGIRILDNANEMEIALFDITPVRLDDRTCRLVFEYEGIQRAIVLGTDGVALAEGAGVLIAFPSASPTETYLHELITEYPPTLYFADGSSVIGPVLNIPAREFPPVPEAALETRLWDDADIRVEHGSAGSRKSVADKVLEMVEEEFPGAYVLSDHGAGEVADFVVVRDEETAVRVGLFHLKRSSNATPGHRMAADIYELAAQAIKSARWAVTTEFWAEIRRRLQERAATQLVVGDADEFETLVHGLVESPKETSFVVYMVQPGLRIQGVTAEARCNTLLLNSYEWLRTQDVELVIVGS